MQGEILVQSTELTALDNYVSSFERLGFRQQASEILLNEIPALRTAPLLVTSLFTCFLGFSKFGNDTMFFISNMKLTAKEKNGQETGNYFLLMRQVRKLISWLGSDVATEMARSPWYENQSDDSTPWIEGYSLVDFSTELHARFACPQNRKGTGPLSLQIKSKVQ